MKTRIRPALVLLLSALTVPLAAQNTGQTVSVRSGGKDYVSYLAAGPGAEQKPGIVLVHSFNGLEQGYKDMVDRFASDGFVVLAVGWQTFEQSPSDATVERLVRDGVAMLKARSDVDPSRIGLTGFCAGGRYTMLLLPVIDDFAAGVAWYGFPYSGGSAAQPVRPVDEIDRLSHPLLMIHGSADQASPITNIFNYATALQKASKYFELKVYEGQPHGFMVQNGQLRKDSIGLDAYQEMVTFFHRNLG
ncbi:MAG TPA: dienelactone hydrolase family protein [Spirochaetia bacterium]|nr:dienelactone hydrolase family protein [Spirochaetia bacterium]